MRLPDLHGAGAVDYGDGAAVVTWPGTGGTIALLIRDLDGLFKFAFYQAKGPIPMDLSRASDDVARTAIAAIRGRAGGCRTLEAIGILITDREHPERYCRSPLVVDARRALEHDPPKDMRRLGAQKGIGLYSLRLRSGREYTVVLVRGPKGYLYLGSFRSPAAAA